MTVSHFRTVGLLDGNSCTSPFWRTAFRGGSELWRKKTCGPPNQSIYFAKHTTYGGGKQQLHRFLTSALRPRDRSVALSSPNRPSIQWTGGWTSLTVGLGDLQKETPTTLPICCTKFLFVNYCNNWRTKSLCKKPVLNTKYVRMHGECTILQMESVQYYKSLTMLAICSV